MVGTGWTLTTARGINELGQIVGQGTFQGQQRSFLLTPVPEPAALGILLLTAPVLTRRRR